MTSTPAPSAESSPTSPTPAAGPVPVIYIAGWGHSGSTLMDMVVGSAKSVVSVGEVIFYDYYRTQTPHEKVLKNFECTCGETFDGCLFWHDVDQETTAGDQTAPHLLYDKNNGQRIRWFFRFLGWRLFGSKKKGVEHRDPPELGDDARLFQSVLDRAGPDVKFVCDSSKDFARLARMLMNPGLEIYPVFLVRDGRGVANSYAKKKRAELGMKAVGLLKAAILWIGVNVLTGGVIRFSGRKSVRISYNRFCDDPEGTIRLLNERLGIDIDPENFIQQINDEAYHNLGGNLMRFKKLESIRRDESWRENITGLNRIFLSTLMWPWNTLWVRRRNG